MRSVNDDVETPTLRDLRLSRLGFAGNSDRMDVCTLVLLSSLQSHFRDMVFPEDKEYDPEEIGRATGK